MFLGVQTCFMSHSAWAAVNNFPHLDNFICYGMWEAMCMIQGETGA